MNRIFISACCFAISDRYNAAKTARDVDEMAQKYAGREKALFKALVKKYGPEPGGSVAATAGGTAMRYAWPPQAELRLSETQGGAQLHCEFWAGLTRCFSAATVDERLGNVPPRGLADRLRDAQGCARRCIGFEPMVGLHDFHIVVIVQLLGDLSCKSKK